MLSQNLEKKKTINLNAISMSTKWQSYLQSQEELQG